MKTEQKRDFLINCAYWAVIAAAVYLVFKFIVPISVPVILGILVAYLVIWLSRKLHCTHRVFRICLAVLIYGVIGFLVVLLVAKGVNAATGLGKWLMEIYEYKLLPVAVMCYDWCVETIEHLDPALVTALEKVLEGILSALKSVVTSLSGWAVSFVSGVATGVPSLVISLLTMIFATIFMVSDYERIAAFTREHAPEKVRVLFRKIRFYLTDTLFVVIRSYVLIMLLTFTELSILFAVFGIERPVLKAAVIAVLDILPILGTGGIMIPWAVISLVLGYTGLGIKLFVIYGIVTVVRNYVEPKIVGTQLGLHPIITLVSMFIGLRLFGFWGLFGLPVSISFLWKEREERLKSGLGGKTEG